MMGTVRALAGSLFVFLAFPRPTRKYARSRPGSGKGGIRRPAFVQCPSEVVDPLPPSVREKELELLSSLLQAELLQVAYAGPLESVMRETDRPTMAASVVMGMVSLRMAVFLFDFSAERARWKTASLEPS
nr:hypothetical protein DBT45_10405 [Aerococcus tenax]